ncbi:MAG: hydantoinase/carbamoylase family amidase, partial [Clostridia bacterium]
MNKVRVNEERLGQDLRHLGTFTLAGEGAGAVSRLPWTPEDRGALLWLREQMGALGLTTSIDPLGNLWGVWEVGAGQSLVIGSHRDSVPKGGAFDGALGVMAALEVVRTLRSAGYHLRHNLEVVAWNDEEGARFGTTLFGSRMYVGALETAALEELRDPAGVSLRDAVWQAGFTLDQMRATTTLDRVAAYVELHVEQGPILEREDQEIGVVTGVGGIIQERITLSGTRVHAAYSGGDRQDPVLAAAQALNRLRD